MKICQKYKRVCLIGLILAGLLPLAAPAEELLESIASVRELCAERAAEGLAVHVEAQVVRINPHNRGIFVYDGTDCIYSHGDDLGKDPAVGDIVWVDGETTAGLYAPDIHASEVTVVDHRPLPQGRPFQLHEMYEPNVDCDWVRIRGRLISMTVRRDLHIIQVEVDRNERVLDVQVPYSAENEKELQKKIFSFVEFNAVAGTVANDNRQAIGRFFYVTSSSDFIRTDNNERFDAADDCKIYELMRFDQRVRRSVRTQGLVTAVGQNEIYLRGEYASLRVATTSSDTLRVGDEVEITGFQQMGQVSPRFRARTVTVLAHRKEPPRPVRIRYAEGLTSHLNDDLVQIDAELLNIEERLTRYGNMQTILLCRADKSFFEVRYPEGGQGGADLTPGARLRLTGICSVIRDAEVRWYLHAEGFLLKLRGPDDVLVIRAAPWLTAARMLGLLGIFAGLSLFIFGWVILLRRTVGRQTAIIQDKLAREAVLDERQRIARELHDNLEQGLAGAGIQLGGCLRRIELNAEKEMNFIQTALASVSSEQKSLRALIICREKEAQNDAASAMRSVGVAEHILERCSEESRTSIHDLRGGLLERVNLVEALKLTLHGLVEESGQPAVLNIELHGNPFCLRRAAERNLLLVAKEAVLNALRHADAATIDVDLFYAAGEARLRIADDGCGFNPDAARTKGRFGLRGMKERLQQFNGMFSVSSQLGTGTVIDVKIAAENNEDLG